MTLSLPRRLLALLLGCLVCFSLAAPARAAGRAQLRNDSTHNVGVYLRFKKAPPTSPAPFSVLAPGEEPYQTEATGFLQRVRSAFSDKPAVYVEFLRLMNDFKHLRVAAADLVAGAERLFHAQPEVMASFRHFI